MKQILRYYPKNNSVEWQPGKLQPFDIQFLEDNFVQLRHTCMLYNLCDDQNMDREVAGCSKNLDASHLPTIEAEKFKLGKRKIQNRSILDFC